MEADNDEPPILLRESAKLLGMVAAFTVLLDAAVKANRRAAELEECIDGIRRGARAKLVGSFNNQHGFDGIEMSLRDFRSSLPGAAPQLEARREKFVAPKNPVDGISHMVGTVTAMEVALELVVETNRQAAALRDRLPLLREAIIGQVIGQDVLDNMFDGIDYAMDEIEDLLPPPRVSAA